jgi:hypothetical protein
VGNLFSMRHRRYRLVGPLCVSCLCKHLVITCNIRKLGNLALFCLCLDIEYLKQTLPQTIEPEFFVFLRQLTVEDVILSAIDEGSVAFPR